MKTNQKTTFVVKGGGGLLKRRWYGCTSPKHGV